MTTDVKKSSLQLALDLFVEMTPVQIDQVKSDQDIGYQKNSVFARIVGLGMVARRFVDAAYFIVAQEPGQTDTYQVPLSFFKWLMRWDSRNSKHFSAVIREVKMAMLEVTATPMEDVGPGGTFNDLLIDTDEDRVLPATLQVATPHNDDGDWLELIGRVRVREGAITFRVPPELQKLIKDPENSYWTSLLVTSRFTYIYARSIYDHVLPLLEKKRTDWLPIDLVRSLPGKSDWAKRSEFKYFKRDYLEPAVSQINQLSDISISYETRAGTPGSRKQNQIRFKMERKESAVASKAAMLNSVALFQTLQREFGLSDKQFEKISANRDAWSDSRIENAIEYVRREISRGNKIGRVGSYLMKIIEAGGFVSEADKEIDRIQAELASKQDVAHASKSATFDAVAASVAAANAAADQLRLQEQAEAKEFFIAAEPKIRQDLVRKFVSSKTLGLRTLERQGIKPEDVTDTNILNKPAIAATFCSFVAGELRKSKRASKKTQDVLL